MGLIPPCLDYYLIRTHGRSVFYVLVYFVRIRERVQETLSVGSGYSRWHDHVLPRTIVIKIMCVHQLYHQG